MVFVGLISLEEAFTSSGYKSLPMGFLLGGAARRAELHVISGGDGNYGGWGVLDWLSGSTVKNHNNESTEDDDDYALAEEDVDEKIRKVIEEYRKRIGEKRGKTRRRVNAQG